MFRKSYKSKITHKIGWDYILSISVCIISVSRPYTSQFTHHIHNGKFHFHDFSSGVCTSLKGTVRHTWAHLRCTCTGHPPPPSLYLHSVDYSVLMLFLFTDLSTEVWAMLLPKPCQQIKPEQRHSGEMQLVSQNLIYSLWFFLSLPPLLNLKVKKKVIKCKTTQWNPAGNWFLV